MRAARPARKDLVQFARFVVVGVLNTAFSYAIYALLLYFGFNYAVANLTALVIGVLFSFKTQGRLVFANADNGRIVRFAAVWAVLYFFNIFVISRFIALGFDPYVSGAFALPFSTVLSFVAQKFFVFGDGVLLKVAASDAMRTRLARVASVALLIAFMGFWHVRSTGTVSPAALALLAALPMMWLVFGRLFGRATTRWLVCRSGIAYELLAGFFCCNTLLFILTLFSPLGMAVHVAGLALLAVLGHFLPGTRQTVERGGLAGELGSLACIAFSGLAATLWLRDAQPIALVDGSFTIYRTWSDLFIHVREISAFAQSHGIASVADIKFAGQPAPVYHFASYMFPAALNALTTTSAIDSFVAFLLPFGITLSGLAAYVLVSTVLRSIWPGVIGAAAIVALPDPYQQGFAIRFFSYHFMTQANLTMFYGLACISLAWVFMIEACRRGRAGGVLIAYAFLSLCVAYKAHLFVANALILMLYPCVFLAREDRRIRTWWRVVVALSFIGIYAVAVSLSQLSPRVPTLRYDGSGITEYVRILMGGFSDGWLKSGFDWLYYQHRLPFVVNAVLDLLLIVVGSFGLWLVVAPLAYWKSRRTTQPRAWGFVLLVTVNYVLMALVLSLDMRGASTPEEFSNRPQAWAYFVLVAFASAGLATWLWGKRGIPGPRLRWLVVPAAGLMLFVVHEEARDLQTFPEYGAFSYADFNRVDTCQVRAAQYVRDHGRKGDLLQDSQFDPRFVTTAIAERQAFVVGSTFGGSPHLMTERVESVRRVIATTDAKALRSWARANQVDWYLMHPDGSAGWDAAFLAQATFRCGDYRLFRFGT